MPGQNNLIKTNRIDFLNDDGSTATSLYLSGGVLSIDGAAIEAASQVLNTVLTGFVSGAGTVTASDTILTAFDKLDGNVNAVKHIASNTQTNDYTLALTDDGLLVIMNKASANNLTIPAHGTVNFPLGTQILVQQLGAGQTTIVAAMGVTTQSALGLKIVAQYGIASLIKVATDTWVVTGALTS